MGRAANVRNEIVIERTPPLGTSYGSMKVARVCVTSKPWRLMSAPEMSISVSSSGTTSSPSAGAPPPPMLAFG